MTLIDDTRQVPVLSSPSLTKAVADSLEITRFIAERYPQLVPQSHSQEVLELLNELHEINVSGLKRWAPGEVVADFEIVFLDQLRGKDIL